VPLPGKLPKLLKCCCRKQRSLNTKDAWLFQGEMVEGERVEEEGTL
jgi:hypothetical protein